jgi:hypothetical protein
MRKALTNSSVLVVAIVYGVLLKIASAAGLFGLVLAVMVHLSLWRYSYAVLRSLAQGRPNVLAPDAESLNPFTEWRLVVHYFFLALAIFLFRTTPLFGDGLLGDAVQLVGTGALVIGFPASAAIMGFTGNPAAALNPTNIAGVIRTMGGGYVRLLAACGSLMAFTELVPVVLGRGGFALLLRDIGATWGILAVFALIGAALRDHRGVFDIPGERIDDAELRQRDRERDWRRTLDLAYGSIRSGLVAEGYRAIKELLAAEADSVDVHHWVFNHMLTWQEQTHALQFGQRFVERLIEAGRAHTALELLAQCRRISGDFAVSAAAAERLAAYARTIGRHGVADELWPLSPRAPSP